MGRVSESIIESHERGFDFLENLAICNDCIIEPFLKQQISANLSSKTCSFCSKTSTFDVACDFNVLTSFVLEGLKSQFGDPSEEGIPYESREGGWQFPTTSTFELLFEHEIADLDIIQKLSESIHQDVWCLKDPYSLRLDETYMSAWESFCNFVTHNSRYFFLQTQNGDYDPNQHDEINPKDILSILGNTIKELALIKRLPIECILKRVRIVEPHESINGAKELGSPPLDFCNQPNRMSPAGVSMFYGAFKLETAFVETFSSDYGNDKKVVCGHFSPSKNLVLVDLTKNISLPSLFDIKKRNLRSAIKFLIEFIRDFTKPIERGSKGNVEYVPTQVVTEYLRSVFSMDGKNIDGILYPSSRNDEESIVIFADSSNCADDGSEDENTILILKNITEYKIELELSSL